MTAPESVDPLFDRPGVDGLPVSPWASLLSLRAARLHARLLAGADPRAALLAAGGAAVRELGELGLLHVTSSPPSLAVTANPDDRERQVVWTAAPPPPAAAAERRESTCTGPSSTSGPTT